MRSWNIKCKWQFIWFLLHYLYLILFSLTKYLVYVKFVRLKINKLCHQIGYMWHIRAMNCNGNLIYDRDDIIICYSKVNRPADD